MKDIIVKDLVRDGTKCYAYEGFFRGCGRGVTAAKGGRCYRTGGRREGCAEERGSKPTANTEVSMQLSDGMQRRG